MVFCGMGAPAGRSNRMSQTLPQPVPAVSRRLAQFGVALIALILVACFAVLIAARAEGRPTQDVHTSLVSR